MSTVNLNTPTVASHSRVDTSIQTAGQSYLPQQAESQAQKSQDNRQIDQPLSPAQKQKTSLNASILASAQTTIGVKDQPLALLLNTAIERINELLSPELGTNAIQKSVDDGLDVSPDATAERIVSLSTAFFGAYKAQHSGEDDSVVLKQFMETIGSGIEQGFAEAREILQGLNVLEGDIASDIDKTYTLIQEKLAAFSAMMSPQDDGQIAAE